MHKQGQEKFLSFILERVQEGKEDVAREILLENFRKQNEGSFPQKIFKRLSLKSLTY